MSMFIIKKNLAKRLLEETGYVLEKKSNGGQTVNNNYLKSTNWFFQISANNKN